MEYPIIKERKKRGWKFWLIFWLTSIVLLFCWAVFLQVKNKGWAGVISLVRPLVRVMPASVEKKDEVRAIFDIASQITSDQQERTYLILFQNNLELRPGGGFIGSFGILKMKGGKVTAIDTHDTNIVDSRIESGVEPPYPMAKMLHIKDWEMRDSNWSPDFPTNAKKAEEFYHLENGTEQFDGVVAISTDLLTSFLEITGPVTVEGYQGEYNSDNAVMKLEYQVEKGYSEQGQDIGQRKYIMKDLSKAIIDKVQQLSLARKKDLLLTIEKHLNNKDIMIYFKNDDLQQKIRQLGWSGEVKDSSQDYLMMLDANMGSLKTDLKIKRSFEYQVDLSGEKPKAILKISYTNTGQNKDFMTKDYDTYLRVYVPKGSWLVSAEGTGEQTFGEDFGEKYFGFLVNVPLGQQKTVVLEYELPESVAQSDYDLLIQKQSGVGTVPGKITIIDKNSSSKNYNLELQKDWQLSSQK